MSMIRIKRSWGGTETVTLDTQRSLRSTAGGGEEKADHHASSAGGVSTGLGGAITRHPNKVKCIHARADPPPSKPDSGHGELETC